MYGMKVGYKTGGWSTIQLGTFGKTGITRLPQACDFDSSRIVSQFIGGMGDRFCSILWKH